MIESRRHSDALKLRLDELAHRGFTIIQMYELYAWYGRKRLTSNVFRHLLETYEEVAGEKRRLSVLADEAGYLLVESSRLAPAITAFNLDKES